MSDLTSKDVVGALRELIRLKDLKTDAEAINTSGSWSAVHRRDAMLAEYRAKKGEAWDAARRALTEHERRAPETKAEWVPPAPVECEIDGMHIVQLDHPDYLAAGATPEEARLNFWKGLALTFWERWKAGLPLDCEPHQSPVKSEVKS